MKKKLFWQSLLYYGLFWIGSGIITFAMMYVAYFVGMFDDNGIMLPTKISMAGVAGLLICLICSRRIGRHVDCVHEAGHVVMSKLHGCKVECVITTKVWHAKLGDDEQVLRIKICLAGWAAEEICGCRFAMVGSDSDLKTAYGEAISYLGCVSRSDVETFLISLYFETLMELEQEKDAISRLAYELGKRKRLNADEIDSILCQGVIV